MDLPRILPMSLILLTVTKASQILKFGSAPWPVMQRKLFVDFDCAVLVLNCDSFDSVMTMMSEIRVITESKESQFRQFHPQITPQTSQFKGPSLKF